MNQIPYALRLLLVACAGLGTFYATSQWAMGGRVPRAEDDDLVVQPAARQVERSAPVPAKTEPIAAQDEDALPGPAERSRSIPGSRGDPFAHLSWLPPPAPPPPPPPPAPPPRPAAPVAPALPFTFIGLLERNADKTEAFLARGDALLVVSAGDLLDNKTYRVETVNSNEIVMTYLPMNIQQTLSVSGRSK